MTPKSIFGQRAKHIRKSGECWLWTAAAPNGIPKTYGGSNGNAWTKRAVAYALEAVGQTLEGRYETTCLQPLCVHPEHAVPEQSEPGRMVFIQSNVQTVGDCQEWLGWCSNLTPYMIFGDTEISVRKFQYCVEYLLPGEDWPEGDYLATCETPLCVTPSHIQPPAVKDPTLTENRSEWMPVLMLPGGTGFTRHKRF